MISEKTIPQTDFEGKKFLQGNIITGEFVAHDSGKKSYSAAVVCPEKNAITSGLGEKILSPPNHQYPHPPSMSNGRPFFYPKLAQAGACSLE